MATESRKRSTSNITTSEDKILKSIYCRKCQRNKLPKEFYDASDELLDTNGKMSICHTCIDEIFERFYSSEHSLEKSIYKTCKHLNILYNVDAVEMTKVHMSKKEDAGSALHSIFGAYKMKLIFLVSKGTIGADLTFQIPTKDFSREVVDSDTNDDENLKYLKDFWGDHLSLDEYKFLEKEYSNFNSTHKLETYTEKVLLKLICFKLLEIDKQQKEDGKINATSVKELQSLLDNSAITPKMSKAIDEGPNLDVLGAWIADTEKYEPAEWLEQEGHEMYHDVADVDAYFEKYIRRPIANLILESKDFNIEEEINDYSEEFDVPSLKEDDDKDERELPK